VVNDKVVTIRINDQDGYSIHFTTGAKYLTGLRFISDGLMEIDAVELGVWMER
jgi:hypothetical protein